ncbi:MAG: ATP synthase F1 subunit epsilon [Deferribacteraceae bacterium]|jgi:F-type H+-transporting ATPase subunit epsilon|nr:ATP synthase F1 subunit epsilon [Deferribacteraceae bacterium]
MPDKLSLNLVTPDKLLISCSTDEIYASGSEGDMGILPGHAALFCSLRSGGFRYTTAGVAEYAAVDGGFMEVKDDKVTVLADSAELGNAIDYDAAKILKDESEQELAKHKGAEDEAVYIDRYNKAALRFNIAEQCRKKV